MSRHSAIAAGEKGEKRERERGREKERERERERKKKKERRKMPPKTFRSNEISPPSLLNMKEENF